VKPHSARSNTELVETAFAFLAPLGFELKDRWVTDGDSFRDGWRLIYSHQHVEVLAQYLDSQFEVEFKRGDVSATYLKVDRELFARRSGYHGDMFDPDELVRVIPRIADDIRTNYGLLLAGDDAEWDRIRRLM
jgi:hypothetical protein